MSIENTNPDLLLGAVDEQQDFSLGEYGRQIGLKGFDFTGFNRYLETGGAEPSDGFESQIDIATDL